MIKGINRQVIEVTETGNAYFERALLVVRPSYRDDDEKTRPEPDGSSRVFSVRKALIHFVREPFYTRARKNSRGKRNRILPSGCTG